MHYQITKINFKFYGVRYARLSQITCTLDFRRTVKDVKATDAPHIALRDFIFYDRIRNNSNI